MEDNCGYSGLKSVVQMYIMRDIKKAEVEMDKKSKKMYASKHFTANKPVQV